MPKNRGFTLVEMIVAIVIIGVIAAASAPVLVASLSAYNTTLDTAVTLDKLRYASERIAREMREAVVTGATTPLNRSTSAPQFQRIDYPAAGGAGTSRIVSITQSGATVGLGYSTPAVTSVLTDQLSSLSFAYFDQDNGAPASAADVRYIEINLALLASNGTTYAQTTRIALRNR